MGSREILDGGRMKAVSGIVLGAIPTDLTSKRADELVRSGAVRRGVQSRIAEVLRGELQAPSSRPQPVRGWLDRILAGEKRRTDRFFGKEPSRFNRDLFAATLEHLGEDSVRALSRKFGLKVVYIPSVELSPEAKFLGVKTLLSDWYRDCVAAGEIWLPDATGALMPVAKVGLTEAVAIADPRVKPAYDSGRQMYPRDCFLGPILEQLRANGALEDYNPRASRFNVSAGEWDEFVYPAVRAAVDLDGVVWRLETYPEFWYLGHVLRPGDGQTDTSVWFGERYKQDAVDRLLGGHSGHGGLTDCCWYKSWHRWYSGAVRPLGVCALGS